MTRAEQPDRLGDFDAALVADSGERAVRALLRHQPLRRLWSAQLVGSTGDALALLVLVLLGLEAAVTEGALGGGERGAALAVAAVVGARLLASVLFGAVLLGPLTALTGPGGALDRRWTMIGADAVRIALLVVAPLWIDWTPGNALWYLLGTVFVTGAAERLWTISREGAAPALLPSPPIEGGAVRPLPDHLGALRPLSQRTGFLAVPAAAAVLFVATLVGNLLGSRHRLVHPAPGRPRLVRRRRALRRLRHRPVRDGAPRRGDAPAPLAAGGPAPPGRREGPYGGRLPARPGLRHRRRGHRRRRVRRRPPRLRPGRWPGHVRPPDPGAQRRHRRRHPHRAQGPAGPVPTASCWPSSPPSPASR